MFLATVVVGVCAVAAITVAPLYVDRLPLRRSPALGMTLVFAAVGIACLAVRNASGAVPLRAELVLFAFPALLAGTLLLLARDDDRNDGGSSGRDGDPPWWPEFEDSFRRYSRRPRVPVGR
jgi:hypothetical protein